MKWAIIVLIMMSLIGSMMWVMPTKRQRFLADLRMKATRLGFQVQLVRLTPPRAMGQVEAETFSTSAYRLPRLDMKKPQRDQFKEWQIFRQEALSNEGLPQGWCWAAGERQLTESQLQALAQFIGELPAGIAAIESTPIHLTLFWDERGDEAMLNSLKEKMQRMLEKQF